MMTAVAIRPERLRAHIAAALGARLRQITLALEEVTVVLAAADYFDAMRVLRDDPVCRFEQLIDLCAVDYSTYADAVQQGPRYCVVAHLLSVSLNQRLRVKVFCPDDDFPLLPSVCGLWNSANWYEREAFDLFGILFDGHDHLRRILTHYDFIAPPPQRLPPLPAPKKARWGPAGRGGPGERVPMGPRELTPRIIREDHYAD